MGTLEGRVAVVTGAGRGIGAAVARALAWEGARVVASARTAAELEAVAEGIRADGGEAWAVPADVADPEQVEALERRTREVAGAPAAILVNNAGIAPSAPLKAITLEDWNRTFAVNVTGVFLCTQRFVPAMVERGWGRVVNVASVAARGGAPYIAAYAASKHAVLGFTRSIALEVAAKGVTVNAVCPGYVDTPMTDASVANIVAKTGRSAEEARALLARHSPQGRLIDPEEVAYLVVVLSDPRARGVNGQGLVVDGGAVQA